LRLHWAVMWGLWPKPQALALVTLSSSWKTAERVSAGTMLWDPPSEQEGMLNLCMEAAVGAINVLFRLLWRHGGWYARDTVLAWHVLAVELKHLLFVELLSCMCAM